MSAASMQKQYKDYLQAVFTDLCKDATTPMDKVRARVAIMALDLREVSARGHIILAFNTTNAIGVKEFENAEQATQFLQQVEAPAELIDACAEALPPHGNLRLVICQDEHLCVYDIAFVSTNVVGLA